MVLRPHRKPSDKRRDERLHRHSENPPSEDGRQPRRRHREGNGLQPRDSHRRHHMYDKKIIESVCQGNTVNTGSTLYAPALPGSFIGTDGVVDRTKHKPYVNINPSTGFRKELETVLPVFSGNVLDSGGAHIGLVTDSATGRTDGFMTPGNTIDITGKKIRSLNADGSGIGSIKFVNVETDAVAATIASLTINDSGRVILVVPASLTDGTYRLEIETYYSNNNTFLKSPRTLIYTPLYIGKVPSSGGSGEDERPGEL